MAQIAGAADRVYWANTGGFGGVGPEGISYANLDGSGGADLNTAGATVNTSVGAAVDSAAGRIYWPNANGTVISFAALNGSGGGDLSTSGATVSGPVGTAVDPAAGRVYWANSAANSISYAELDGSGGGDINTTGAIIDLPEGLAIDPAGGRVYWTNTGLAGGAMGISYARLDGSGGGNLNTGAATVAAPLGVAIDSAAGRIYWPNLAADVISFAALDGSGGGNLSTPGATLNNPGGVAIDPVAQKIYWANTDVSGGGGPQGISYANLDGSGGGDLSTAGATLNAPGLPSVQIVPLGTGAPTLSGGPGHRSRLSCSQASWAADVPQSFFFRAPTTTTYRWSRNAKKIHGAKKRIYRAHAIGNYRCTVTAENAAGKTHQTSSTHTAFAFGRTYRNKNRGTAKLIVRLPSRGRVTLSGKTLKNLNRRPRPAGNQKHLFKAALPINAQGKAKLRLKRTGHSKLKLKVRFEPKGAKGGTLTRTVTLRLRQPPSRTQGSFPLGLGRGT